MAMITTQHPEFSDFDEESGESGTSSSDGEAEPRMALSRRAVAAAIASSVFVVSMVMAFMGGFDSLSSTANTEKEQLFHVMGKGSSTPWWSFAAVGGLVSAKLIGGTFGCLGHCGTVVCNGIGTATYNCWSAIGCCGTSICNFVGGAYGACFSWIGGCFGSICNAITNCLGSCPLCGNCLGNISFSIGNCCGAIYSTIGNVIAMIYNGIFNCISALCGMFAGCVHTIYTGLANCCANIWGGLDRCCASCCPWCY